MRKKLYIRRTSAHSVFLGQAMAPLYTIHDHEVTTTATALFGVRPKFIW